MFVTKVGEPPYVSKSDAVAEESEEELEGVAPLCPVSGFRDAPSSPLRVTAPPLGARLPTRAGPELVQWTEEPTVVDHDDGLSPFGRMQQSVEKELTSWLHREKAHLFRQVS